MVLRMKVFPGWWHWIGLSYLRMVDARIALNLLNVAVFQWHWMSPPSVHLSKCIMWFRVASDQYWNYVPYWPLFWLSRNLQCLWKWNKETASDVLKNCYTNIELKLDRNAGMGGIRWARTSETGRGWVSCEYYGFHFDRFPMCIVWCKK